MSLQISGAGDTSLIRYVNLTINNPTGQPNINASFDQNYERDIIKSPNNYLLSVVSATVTMQNTPLFIFPVETNQAAAAGQLGTMKVGVCYNMDPSNIANGTYEAVFNQMQNLIWIPQEMGLSPSVQSSTGPMTVTPYYYVYSYEWFVNLVNTAMQTAWAAAGSPGGVGKYPVFSFDETTKLFSWNLPVDFMDAAGPTYGWSVCWNEDFDNILNNFNVIDNGGSRPWIYPNGIFILEDVKTRPNHLVSTNMIVAQDYATTDNFNSAQRLVILTNSIPTAVEYFPATYAQSLNGNTAQLSSTRNILVDIPLDFDNNITFQRSTLVYSPREKQYADLQTSAPIRRISVQAQWVDRQNQFYDIPIRKSDVVTVRLMFIHKSLFMKMV